MTQYADQVFMFLNGIHYPISSVDWDISFGQMTPVQTMNPTGRPLGFKQSVGEGSINVESPVNALQPNWMMIDNATIVFVQRVGGAPIYTAIGASYDSHTAGSNTDGEQVVKVKFNVLDWKEGL